MKKIMLLIISILLLNSSVFATDDCQFYGEHEYNELICPLISVCDCGAITGGHEFVDGVCTECGTLLSEINEDGNCPICAEPMDEYYENQIKGYRCADCKYWSLAEYRGTCPKGHDALEWTSIGNVGAYICIECNEILDAVGSCRNCGSVVVPEIVRGYVVFNCCGYVDDSISIESLGVQQCSKENGKVDGHIWRNKIIRNDSTTTYYIVCNDCSRVIDVFDVFTVVSNNGDIQTLTSDSSTYDFLQCVCGGAEKVEPENWRIKGWNNGWSVTNEIHYTVCSECGAVKRSGPHEYIDGKCRTCTMADPGSDIDLCVCDGAEKTEPENWRENGWNNGWSITDTIHYTVCQKCNKIKRFGKHEFIKGECKTCTVTILKINDNCKHPIEKQKKEYNYSSEIVPKTNMHYYRIICKCGKVVNATRVDEACTPEICACGNIRYSENSSQNQTNIDSIDLPRTFTYKGQTFTLTDYEILSLLNTLQREIGSSSTVAPIIAVGQAFFNGCIQFDQNVSTRVTQGFNKANLVGSGSSYDISWDVNNYSPNVIEAYKQLASNSDISQQVADIIGNSTMYAGTADANCNNHYIESLESYEGRGSYIVTGTIIDNGDKWVHRIFSEVSNGTCANCSIDTLPKYLSADDVCFECGYKCCKKCGYSTKWGYTWRPMVNGYCEYCN